MAGMLSRLRKEEGVGVVTALMITLVVFALGATWTQVGLHEVGISAHGRHRDQALHAAEAGLNAAAAALVTDPAHAGSGLTALGDGTGEFEVTVTPVNPADPADLRRSIDAVGYAPDKDTPRRVQRRLIQQVLLRPEQGSGTSGAFDWALFAAPGGIVSGDSVVATGDVYAHASVVLQNGQKIFGDVVTQGSIEIANSGTIGGDVHMAGHLNLSNSATVEGNALVGGAASLVNSATVMGDLQAGGSVTFANSAVVEGTTTANTPPPPPPSIPMPTFSWDPANYTNPQTWSSAAAFKAYWSLNRNAFSGHHRITDAALLTLDKDTTLTGNTTIVSDGPIKVTRDIHDTSGGGATLVMASLHDSATPVLHFTNSVTPPASLTVAFYAPFGPARFENSNDYHGVVYAEAIDIGNSFTLTWTPVSVPGFTFPPATGGAPSASRYDIVVQTFREVPPGA